MYIQASMAQLLMSRAMGLIASAAELLISLSNEEPCYGYATSMTGSLL